MYTYSVHSHVSTAVISFVRYDRGLLAVSEVTGVELRGIDPHCSAVIVHRVSNVVRTACAVGQLCVWYSVVSWFLCDSWNNLSHENKLGENSESLESALPRMDEPRGLYPLKFIECVWSLVTITRVSSVSIIPRVALTASENRTVSSRAWAAWPRWWAKSIIPPSTWKNLISIISISPNHVIGIRYH